ncbi:uncharacterized protein BXZ73DRAFT_93308 [Epithele typhae]|uniref:uncharacterized protein n=1 Tax=Epithele typhae TaxID=378194 RepID=UPI002007DD7D|nr:uncharacterized protein BXZ73DRAFT_93308 [Epithele typhae]KAH9911814.1 hypothetical protein BXZ73DRAFT_93308 [Epithele typhae]
MHVSVFHHAVSTFYAPSELAETTGMHRELLRCNPDWNSGKGRYDPCFVMTNPTEIGLDALTVARLRVCISFTYEGVQHECALVEWFERDVLDVETGMLTVRHELDADDEDHEHTDTLDRLERFYVNWYADYHAHEHLL